MRAFKVVRVLGILVFAALVLTPTASASFELGLQDVDFEWRGPTLQQHGYDVLTEIRGSSVRLNLQWAAVAPAGGVKPRGFNAANPAAPAYRWGHADAVVKAAAAHHAKVILDIVTAPQWALGSNPRADAQQFGGDWEPNPSELAQFARAAAQRYSGHFPDPIAPIQSLPHVAYWEIWNEENLPQALQARHPVNHYREMLNAAYAAIKGVNRRDMVLLGGLAPVSFERYSIPPLRFAAQLLCLRRSSSSFRPIASCSPARFDIFAIHPYTLAATPTKPAYHPDDILIADVSKVPRLIAAARRWHRLPAGRSPALWANEWSWFTNPPDNIVGDSGPTAARYTAYSMYEMWRAGISMITWYVLQDANSQVTHTPSFTLGGGLYDMYGRPKPMLRAFEFPLVAVVQRTRGFVWGRAPVAAPARVIVERLRGGRWRDVGAARTDRDGVFLMRFRTRGNGIYRAVASRGLTSLAYDSRPIPPRRTHLFSSG